MKRIMKEIVGNLVWYVMVVELGKVSFYFALIGLKILIRLGFVEMTFSKGAAPWILDIFGHSIDDEGFIYNKELECRALTPHAEEIHIDEFGGLMKGPNDSMIFIKNDLFSLMKVAKGEYCS